MAEDTKQTPTPLAEITHEPSGFEQFLENNQKGLIAALILVILAVLGWIVYRGVEEGKRLSASHALYEAQDATSLEAVVAEHQGTPSAGTAQILLAHQQTAQNEPGSAIESLNDFLSGSAKHPATPAAMAALAATEMNQGNPAAATEKFQEILDSTEARYLAPYALLCLGDIAAEAGKADEAEKYYQQAKTEYPTSAFLMRINQRISGLGAEMPEEIEPPAAPPENTGIKLPAIPTPLIPQEDVGTQESPEPERSLNQPATNEATPAPPMENAETDQDPSSPEPSE